MKKTPYYLTNFAVTCLCGFLYIWFYVPEVIFANMEFFVTPTAAEYLWSAVEFFLPFLILAGIIAAACFWGRRHFEVWRWRDRILTVLIYLIGFVLSSIVTVYMYQ